MAREAAVIVTCPACETRYLVDEAELGGEAGRRVRCASCGNLWHYSAEAAAIHLAVAAITAELTAAQSDGRPAAPSLASTAPRPAALRAEPGTEASPPPVGAVARPARPSVALPSGTLPSGTLPSGALPPAVAVRRPPAGGAWLLAVALIAAVAMVAVLGRDKIVALYPPIAPLYHRLHLAVPSNSGLRITSTVTREGDRLTVGGDIVNDSQEPQHLRRLRVTLRDGDQRAVETRVIAPPIARLPPGLTVYYSTTFERPNITVAGAEVGFAGE